MDDGQWINEPQAARDISAYIRYPARYGCAEAARLLVDGGQVFPEMLKAIAGAQKHIDLETYILRADATGVKFQQALMAAAQRGVAVRLLYDGFGSLGLPKDYVSRLLAAGVAVRIFHPLVWTRPVWVINRRTHRKILVVDGQIGFTGGLNIGQDYAAREEGGQGWHDIHVRLDGAEVADQFVALFEYGWNRAIPYERSATGISRLRSSPRLSLRLRRRTSRKEKAPQLCPEGGLAVKILGNQLFRFRHRIQRAYLYAIQQAQDYILIENAYFIPNRQVRQALIGAAQRGVAVAVIAAEKSDVGITNYARRYGYQELLAGGVRIFEWPLGVIHTKTAVIDDAWTIVGSYNFDHRSLWHQLEVVAVILNQTFAATCRRHLAADIRQCREITSDQHRRRPFGQKVLEILAHGLRSWL